jgi:hypothetical protein
MRRRILIAMLGENCRPCLRCRRARRDERSAFVRRRAGIDRLFGRRSATATQQTHDQPRIDAEK